MKRFLSAVVFCVFLLSLGLFVLLPSTQAEKNLLENLLKLPAPPPPNPYITVRKSNYPTEFYDKKNPPNDNAPIEDLLAYWQLQSSLYTELGYNIKPSDESLRRILGEIEKDPEKLPNFLNTLPANSETADFVKRQYDREISNRSFGSDWRQTVKRWLTFNSSYFSDELLKVARQVGDANEYVTNQDELLALARVDFEKARPILDRLYNDSRQPVSQILARWALYRRALATDSSSDIEKYRSELKAIVENKSATPGMRDLALDALVKEKEWKERDDWYLSLLGDETLADLRVNGQSYTGLTTIIYHSPPEKYSDKMLELLKSDNKAVRSAAVRNLSLLINDKNPEIVTALLPWLENPEWATETNGERRRIIGSLANFTIPESVPGLIAVLDEKEKRSVPSYVGNMNTAMVNIGNMNTAIINANMAGNPNMSVTVVDYYQYRDAAVSALIKQKDARAIPALRAILPEAESWTRGNVVQALLVSGGFTVTEQVEALEFIAKALNNEQMSGNSNVNTSSRVDTMSAIIGMGNSSVANTGAEDLYSYLTRPFDPADIKPILGMRLVNEHEPDSELVSAVAVRISVLETRDPSLAFSLRKIVQKWRGAAVNALLLSDLKNNKADVDSVVKLLSLRKELREKQINDVFGIRSGSPIALGISACLLENISDYDALLDGENIEAKIAMLGCARLIRADLPVQKVAPYLRSPNKLLATAAERYLEAEDSPEARALVLSLYPNEAKILGARLYFAVEGSKVLPSPFLSDLFTSVNESFANYYLYYTYPADIEEAEKRFRQEVKEDKELLGVYAYDNNFVKIYGDKAVFIWQEDKARYRERVLEKQEFENIKSYLAAERVNELPPFVLECDEECETKELLMLGRQGGRRVFLMGDELPKFFAGLEAIFNDMRQSPAKLHYRLEKNVAGLEILFEDENLQAAAVWKNGEDFRVLINNEVRRKQIEKELEMQDEADDSDDSDYEKLEALRQKRREARQYENFAWHKFDGSKLAGIIEHPAQIEFPPVPDGAPVAADSQRWKTRTANFEIRANNQGLYKITRGQAARIRTGYYEHPLITPNGRWAIVSKYGDEGPELVRVNLLTNRELKVKFDEFEVVEPVAFVPAINRVLIFNGGYSDHHYEMEEDITERPGEYFFLDPETGALQKVKGEIRPLAQQTFRPLQTTGNANEFWAAIPDKEKNETQIGVYNTKTLSFKPSLKLPHIKFTSMEMWIDAGKVYFAYQGHLLSLPLAAGAK